MKTKAQIKKAIQKRNDVRDLINTYKQDPEFGKKMAKLTGAMYLSIAVVDICQQEIDELTHKLMIPARLRKTIKDLSTACDRVIRAEEQNDLMDIDNSTFQQLTDDGMLIKDLLISMTGLSFSSFHKVSAYARNLSEQEAIKRQKEEVA